MSTVLCCVQMLAGLGEGNWEPGLGNECETRREWLALYMKAGMGEKVGHRHLQQSTVCLSLFYHPFKGKDLLQVLMHAADLVWSF